MIPLRDANPSSRTPWVTFLIIGLNILAFLYEVALPESRLGQLIFTLGMGPARGGGVPGGPGAGGLGGYLLLYPHARVLTLIPAFFLYMVELPAYIVLALWFVIQLFSGTASLGARGASARGGGGPGPGGSKGWGGAGLCPFLLFSGGVPCRTAGGKPLPYPRAF